MSLTFEKFRSLINEKLTAWVELTVKNLPNVVIAFVVFLLFFLLSKVFSRWIQNLLNRVFQSHQITGLIAGISRIIFIAIGFFFALDIMGLSKAVASLLAGAGIIGLAIGFAFQDMTENLIAGVAMGIRKPFQVGDVIEADDVFGTVKAINLRNTLVETFFGQLELVPNKILFRNILTNYSYNGVRCIEIPVGISYADDIEKASEAIVENINQCDFVINKQETAVYAEGFDDSSVKLLVWFWINYPGQKGFMQARHEGVANIKRALAEADISIPFPIRTLDFGIKGGEKLSAMMSARKESEAETD
ncbi:mechanosensitive ion channel family protein [Thalassotalea sp. PP2-459]|uniref:mechanosensitive ion channel family protein n=1 Tax=Thalassotalea sp. PP2-459 TaxID=1742724 RepID=UPI0009451566|nr:mechanosensitive ion channel family protein [Thalassotalea sp. PP2-459]OKY26048.1 mechanosensitive ion channel protein [Thalassotalea sp. PP2-459]